MGTNYYAVIETQEAYDTVMSQEDWITTKHFALDKSEPWDKTLCIHIGKISGGWEFHLHGRRDLTNNPFNSWQSWKKFLIENCELVVDEYGELQAVEDFIAEIEEYWAPGCKWQGNGELLKSHYDYVFNDSNKMLYGSYLRTIYKDDDGYTLTSVEFS